MNDVDNSRLETYQTCPQLFDFKYNHEVGESGNWKANYSTWMIHLPCQEWYASGGKYEPNWALLMKAWGPTPEEMLQDKFGNYTAARAAKLFNEFVEKATNRGDLEEYEYLEHEQYVKRDIGMPTQWGAKTDLLMRHKATGKKHAFEIKASRWDYILTGLQFNRQILGEIYVNEAEKVIVIFFNLNAKKGQDGVMFIEVEPTQEEMNSWLDSVRVEVGHLRDSYAAKVWPRRTSACRRFNQTCEFLDICEQGGSASTAGMALVNDMPKQDSLSYLTTADVNVNIII